MQSSITEHPYGALSIPAVCPEEQRVHARQDLARIVALDPEQLPLALAFLSGYYPRVFDAVMEAVEPCDGPGAEDETSAQEPFCVKCGVPVGVFLAHGTDPALLLAPEARGRGLATEATLLTLDYGFHITALRMIWLKVLEPNTPGIRAYAAAGFKSAGRLRQSGYWLGQLCDELVMDALPEDYPGPSHFSA